ncbi:MAG TPA: hypothetical protein VGC00_00010 [Thermoanaerobaculia bacterium]
MRRAATHLALAATVVLAVACSGGSAPARAPFRAVWLAADSVPLDRAEANRLAAAGAGELFLEVGRVAWDGVRAEIVGVPLRPLARETPATLVVGGGWSAVGEASRQLADAWRDRLDSLSLAARAAGAVPVGVHFQLDVEGDVEALAATLRRLRRSLRGRLFVSVALDLERLDEASALSLAAASDFVLADVFGQPPGSPDDPRRWDLAPTRERLARLERLGSPYGVVAWTLGGAELRRRGGETMPIRGGLPLGRLLRSPRFVVRPGSVFAGIDRQVFALEAREATALGPWTLERGDVVWAARPTTHDLEDVLHLLAEPASGRRLGVVLRALPAVGDTVSLAAANLAAALEPGDAAPDLTVSLVAAGGARGRTRLRVRLANDNAETTELGGGEWNYVQLEFPAGALGAVAPGDFVGWDQLWQGRERRTLRALRQADTLRLFAPYVGAGETLESGTIELRGRGGEAPAVRTSARFFLPGGREHVLAEAPATWIVGAGEGGSE